jgi:hypothetical protein
MNEETAFGRNTAFTVVIRCARRIGLVDKRQSTGAPVDSKLSRPIANHNFVNPLSFIAERDVRQRSTRS